MPELDALFRLAKWTESDDTLLRRLTSGWMETNFALLCALMRDQRASLAMLEQLDDAAVVRLLLAPSFGYALRAGDRAAVAALIRAEADPYETWSALGDIWHGAAPPPHARDVLRKSDGVFHAPRLSCGIPIDLSITTAATVPSTGLKDPVWLDPDEITAALARLDAATDLLAAVNGHAFRLFTALTQNLVLRASATGRASLRSGSSAAALGRIVLVNCQDPQIDTHEIAECLLHEAIHTAISCTELSEPLVAPELATDASLVVPSPWTGAPLHVHAFAHACLVWFALHSFWASRPAPRSTWAAQRLAYIARGFRSRTYETTLRAAAGLLAPHAAAVLFQARECIPAGDEGDEPGVFLDHRADHAARRRGGLRGGLLAAEAAADPAE